MSTLLIGKFSSYHLTTREEIHGGALTITQRELLTNDRALVAEQILSFVIDLNDIVETTKQDSYLKGQLAVYNFILDRDEECQRMIAAGEDLTS